MEKLLYHGTSSKNLTAILESGLVGGINLTEIRNANKDVVFLTTSYQSARGYAGRSKKQRGGQAVVLVVKNDSAKPWKNKKKCSIYITKAVVVKEILEIRYL